MISTANLQSLPGVDGFRRLTRALATLDAIMSPEWEDRYYSFDSAWGDGETMASMRTGSGDRWAAVLCDAGVALIGLAHEAPTYSPGKPKPWVFANLPEQFHKNARDQPAFDSANTSYCIWCTTDGKQWSSGVVDEQDDGSSEHLSVLDGDPQRYVDFAREYYEVDLDIEDVRAVYNHEPLTNDLIARLNPETSLEVLTEDLAQIGYPNSG